MNLLIVRIKRELIKEIRFKTLSSLKISHREKQVRPPMSRPTSTEGFFLSHPPAVRSFENKITSRLRTNKVSFRSDRDVFTSRAVYIKSQHCCWANSLSQLSAITAPSKSAASLRARGWLGNGIGWGWKSMSLLPLVGEFWVWCLISEIQPLLYGNKRELNICYCVNLYRLLLVKDYKRCVLKFEVHTMQEMWGYKPKATLCFSAMHLQPQSLST